MAWDIYGNNLREGFCEVHPHVNEYYPCSICYDEIQKEEDRRREHDRQKADYEKAMDYEYSKAMEKRHIEKLESDKAELLEGLEKLLYGNFFNNVERQDFIKSLIQKHKS